MPACQPASLPACHASDADAEKARVYIPSCIIIFLPVYALCGSAVASDSDIDIDIDSNLERGLGIQESESEDHDSQLEPRPSCIQLDDGAWPGLTG